ncbi:MAG TPA: ATP-binding cassette domain-containing protein, partial [Candidatus Caccomorpha excrementavium]|nr:ATP-binding cassette domain-containing protein [Candidatus Caccomorpha excrementavium]
MAYIEFEHISKAFGKETILEDVNFTVEKNEICGFIGRNGSGKTVIFKLLAGLLLPDSGRILYKGEDLTKKK